MFNTKLEVDRHVENCLRKINNDVEHNLRCFAFAKLYFKVGDYEQARRYVSIYLCVKPLSAEAHHLLGKTLEKLGKLDAALDAYRTSLDLDPKQNNLLLKICELLTSDNVNFDQSGARYFCEKAQNIDPYNPVVFSLKERLISLESKDPNEVSKLLLKELETRPADVDLRVRLLRHLLQNNQVKEAYKHAHDIEQKNLSIFANSLNWYETLAEVLMRYQRDTSLSKNLNWEFWILLISTLDKLVALSLDERSVNVKISTEYVTTVFNFDQTLKVAAENVSDCPDKHLIQEFINHYRGQLCLHLVVLIFKQAKKELVKYKEASQITLPLLFAAYHLQPADLQCLWFEHTTEVNKQLALRWHREASFRCSQAGHLLLSVSKDRKLTVIEKATQGSAGLWREQLLKKIFVTRDQQAKIKSSYFTTCPELVELTIRLPDTSEVIKYDQVAQLVYPDSLHHYVWIGLNQKLLQFTCMVFSGLNYSVKNLNSCSAESLNVLDIQAFLYCAILCAQQQIEESKHNIYYPSDRPNLLPAAITGQLGTTNQAKWLISAYKMYKNDYGCDFGEVRLSLIRGIEVVRCIGNHGLDVKLLVTLARTFAERSRTLSKQSEIEFNDVRAELYWRAALPLLEKLKNNQVISYSTNRMFEYKSKEMSHSEIQSYIDDGKLFSAKQLMKKKEHEKALELFEGLKDPYASFYQAQIYKLKAEEQTSQNRESVTSEMRSQNIILLSRARDCLYLTLDRLRDPTVDRKHPLNTQLGTEIEKIERMLSRIDPDVCLNRNECDGMSDENMSSLGSMGDHFNYGFGHSYVNGHLTPRNENHLNSTPLTRREARPSPERLDAQLRQLTASKETTMHHILEQNKFVVESHRALLDEIRGFKDAVNSLTLSVDELKVIKSTVADLQGIKKSVDELKNAVEDLQNITDVVSEMKKELTELKKDTIKIKNNQLSDEDLYVLDEEYGADYGTINSNVAAGLTNNLYQNLGRMPGTNPLPYAPSALYPGMYHPMLHYPGLGLQAGPLAFSPETHMADFRAISSLSQNLTPAGTYPQGAAGLPQTVLPPVGLTQTALPQPPLSQTGLTHSGLVVGQPILPGSGLQSSFTSISSASSASVLPPQPSSVFPSTSQSFLQATTPSSRALPVNVVITSSDPLPTTRTATVQPILSVTVPPQHLKSNQQKIHPHNYQIQLPASSTVTSTLTTPSVMNQPPLPVSTQSILSNVAPPVYSAVAEKSPAKNTSLGVAIEKSLSNSFSNAEDKNNVSSTSTEEHDPCPDFKPIIPLPDEVPVNTGEENETVLFEERAKLFRYTNKEWRERGVGVLKLLKNPATGKVRILMRRDQVHKICANHFITKDMILSPMNKNDKAFIWAANDYADQEVVLEKLCVRFKTSGEAQKFHKAFEDAKKNLPGQDENREQQPNVVTSLGGFVFTSTPTFKPKEEVAVIKPSVQSETPKLSPFATFTFTKPPTTISTTVTFSPVKTDFKPVHKINESLLAKPLTKPEAVAIATSPKGFKSESQDSLVEDFEPNVDFKPIVPLPELVEIKTGEENAEVLFENKAKLLRYDTTIKEWKERGIGVIKILKYEDRIQLIMRRDQVHKICCNHQLMKNVDFTVMSNNPKAVYWYAQDFSEGVLTVEMFVLRFKTAELVRAFLDVISSSQAMLDENNALKKGEKDPDESKVEKKVKGDTELKTTPGKQCSWGDRFKPKSGSWECKICYIVNDSKCNYCVACDSPKNDTVPKKETDNGVQFSFLGTKEAQQVKSDFGFPSSKPELGWGDAFKPKEGSWECKHCYIRNDGAKLYCVSCENPKDETIPKKEASKGLSLDTSGTKFNFGIPKTPANTPITTTSFTFGTPSTKVPLATFSFGTPKLAETSFGTASPKPSEISFGMAPKSAELSFGAPKSTELSFGAPKSTELSFGTPKSKETPSDAPLNLTGSKGFTFSLNESNKDKDKFVFGSPQKHTFEFVPRSPRRHSSGPGDEESEGSYVEEDEDNIYFKPVIPMPDKIEVKTGEEQEDVLYCHRAKLYRFIDGEWKERGIGDVKILARRDTKKLRVLMRREQVLKICLNHALTDSIKYTPKDDKTWLFSAPDYSEGEIQHQQFCLRFKSAEVGQEFKQAVDDALKNAQDKPSEKSNIETSDSDVEIVFETKVTPEEEEEAKKLGLPPKFMSYRQLKDCTCEECKKDDVLLKDLFASSSSKEVAATPTSSSTPSTGLIAPPVFKPPLTESGNNMAVALISPVSPDNLKKSESLKDLLAKPSMFSTAKKQSPFSSPSLVNAASAKTNLFGGNDIVVVIKTPTPTDPLKSFSFSLNKPASIFETQNNIFVSPSKNIFGSSPATGSSIFGNPATTNASNLFATPPTTGNIFGGFSSGSAFSTTKMGGGDSTPSIASTNSFGNPPTTNSASSQVSLGNIFGSTSLFPVSTIASPKFTQSAPTTTSKGSLFGTPTSTSSIFGGPTVFGQSATPIFGGSVFQTKPTSTENQSKEPVQTTTEEPVEKTEAIECNLKFDDNLTFANLAKDSSNTTAFQTTTNNNSDENPFVHLGAGAPIFNAGKKGKKKDTKGKNKEKSNDEGGEERSSDDEYDPHYEPIVPLPDIINLSTGEEDELILFNERAQLYRYDTQTKGWKERGIGQLKVLHHPVNFTYRLLLRREQVYKLVLNQLITTEMNLQQMKTSEKAWLWGGYNYSDECEGIEKLAARFKDVDVAKQFNEVIQKAIASIKERNNKVIPATVVNFGTEEGSEDDERESVGEEDVDEEEEKDYDNQDDDDDYDEEDDRTILCKEKCTLSEQEVEGWKEVCTGEITIYYDPEIFGARINVTDDNDVMKSSTLIGNNTVMTIDDKHCTWRAVEWVDHAFKWRNLRATFDSSKVASEFHLTFLEGASYAEQSEIVDEIPSFEPSE